MHCYILVVSLTLVCSHKILKLKSGGEKLKAQIRGWEELVSSRRRRQAAAADLCLDGCLQVFHNSSRQQLPGAVLPASQPAEQGFLARETFLTQGRGHWQGKQLSVRKTLWAELRGCDWWPADWRLCLNPPTGFLRRSASRSASGTSLLSQGTIDKEHMQSSTINVEWAESLCKTRHFLWNLIWPFKDLTVGADGEFPVCV